MSCPSRRDTILTVDLLLLACAGSAYAQPTPDAATILDPMVVTAARSPQLLTELIADVTYIGPDEIARAGPQSLAELLQRQPGVQIVTNGGPGSTTGVFLRGANSNQTLLLLDGLRIGSSSSGTPPLEAIPLDQIDHIEILRGPAASLYGADAIGGVIQVFTRRAGGAVAANASAGYGTYDTSNLNSGVSGAVGAWRLALQGAHRQSAGFNAIWNPANFSYNPDRDGYANDSGSARIGYVFAPEQELSAQFFKSRLNTQFDAGLGFDDRTITTVESYAVESRNRLASFWTSTLGAGESKDDSDSQTGFGPSQFDTLQRQYLWQSDFALPRGILSVAAIRREERLNTDAGFAVTARNTNAIVGVYQLRAGPSALQANLRHDQSSQYGGRTSGAFSYAYTIVPGWRASASYGTGFKAPTFNDLYFPDFPPFFFSNPNLRPERSRNREAGIDYRSGDRQLGVTLFQNDISDLITVFTDPATFVSNTVNLAQVRTEGMEIAWRGTLWGWQTRAQVTVQDPRDETTGSQLRRRAKQYGSVGAERTFGPWRFGADIIGSGERFDSTNEAPNTRMHGYGLLNLTAGYALTRDWSINARWNNVLDREYELNQFFNTPGSNFFAWVAWQMR